MLVGEMDEEQRGRKVGEEEEQRRKTKRKDEILFRCIQ